jgi:hypothetical protein
MYGSVRNWPFLVPFFQPEWCSPRILKIVLLFMKELLQVLCFIFYYGWPFLKRTVYSLDISKGIYQDMYRKTHVCHLLAPVVHY